MSPKNTTIINYRWVVNDAVVWPWEPMPDAGKTIYDLAEFLKTCTCSRDRLGEAWDYRRLKYGGAWNLHIVTYGAMSQFWIPVVPQESDFTWQHQEELTVECCGRTLRPIQDWDGTPYGCLDEGYIFLCECCGRHTRRYNGKVHRTIKAAWDAWNRLYSESHHKHTLAEKRNVSAEATHES